MLRKRRPFTVVHVNPQGPAYTENTVRKGDRIRAINGINLASTRLPELQGLLYQQDKVYIATGIHSANDTLILSVIQIFYMTCFDFFVRYRKQYLLLNMTL